jgi:hypothetical protein
MFDCKIAKGGDEVRTQKPKLRTVYKWVKTSKELHLRKATSIEADRIRASTKKNIQSFFNLYHQDQSIFNYRKELIVLCSVYNFNFFLV